MRDFGSAVVLAGENLVAWDSTRAPWYCRTKN